MTKPNDGGLAFPVSGESCWDPGMSLRAYLAAKAICLFKGDVSTEFIARSCCNIADALIAELEKEVEEPKEAEADEEPPFKKGQRVRVKPDAGTAYHGCAGVVESATLGWGIARNVWQVKVLLDGGDSPLRFNPEVLETAEEEKPKPKFKVGDPVRVRAGIGIFAGKVGVVEAAFPDTLGEGFKYRLHIDGKGLGFRETFYENQLEAGEEGAKDA